MKHKWTFGERCLVAYWMVAAVGAFLLPWFLIAAALWVLTCCGEPHRLDDPPPIGPLCAYEFEQCGFIDTSDTPCCGEGVCLDNTCYDPSRLIPRPDTCVPLQVDAAILLDRTGSMQTTFSLVTADIQAELLSIPGTTEVQVWDFPHMRDGDFGRSAPPGGPVEAIQTIDLLPSPNPGHSKEASLDAVHELMTGGYWRHGSTLRLVVVVSDEVPQSFASSPVTPQDICDSVTSADRLVAYTRPGGYDKWDEACFETRSIHNIDIGSLIADPCRE